MKRFLRLVVCALALLRANHSNAMGQDLDLAIPPFDTAGKTAVPVDFEYVHLNLAFDPGRRTATGTCRIEFYARDAGHPLLDLVPNPLRVRLNGEELGTGGLPLVSAPGNATRLRMVNAPVQAFSRNLLEVEYSLLPSTVDMAGGGVRMLWAMSDVGADRRFLEQYACSNLEFDQFAMTAYVEIEGPHQAQRIYSNGKVELVRPGAWFISFPRYFTTSSFYLHLSDRNFSRSFETYSGVERAIPILVYGANTSTVRSAMAQTLRVMAELESTYGPYPHESVVAYMNGGSGGMEHVGATVTSLGALAHEITHFWFARGVMPANGNAVWIDEAIASWRDNRYPRYNASLSEAVSNLAGFSPYARTTPMASYSAGMRLMGRLDSFFPQGMRSVLKGVFASHQLRTIDTPGFRALIERLGGRGAGALFNRYVYNGRPPSQVAHTGVPELWPSFPVAPTAGSLHPPPLTQAEIESLR